MTPSIYMDVQAVEVGDAMAILTTIGTAFAIVHGVIRTHGVKLAIALPDARVGRLPHPGATLRAFADDAEALSRLRSELEKSTSLQHRARIGLPTLVPVEFLGPWVEYRRYRIPGLRSRLTESRERRVGAADKLPHIRVGSRSTGQIFNVNVMVRDGERPAGDSCAPDNYGLSLPSRPFALPAF